MYLFTVPGTPVLYYGTEVALPGGADPDNRRMMPWAAADETTRALVRQLAILRQQLPSLRRGSFDKLLSERETLVYAGRGGADTAVVAINGKGDGPQTLALSLADVGLTAAAVLHQTLGPGASGSIKEGMLTITLAPRGAAVFLLGAAVVDPPWAMVAALVALALLALALLAVRLRSRLPRPRRP